MNINEMIADIATVLGQLPAPAYTPTSAPRVFEAFAFGRLAQGLIAREPHQWLAAPANIFRFRQNNGEIWGNQAFTRLRHAHLSVELHQSITCMGESGASHEIDIALVERAQMYRERQMRPRPPDVSLAVDTKWYEDNWVQAGEARTLLGVALDLGVVAADHAHRWNFRRPWWPHPIGACLAAHGSISHQASSLLHGWGQAAVGHLDTNRPTWYFA